MQRLCWSSIKVANLPKAQKLIKQWYSTSVVWVPGHSGIEENKRADKAAKESALGERLSTAKWTSLTHIKQKITEEKKLQINIWYERKTKE